jgi:hypothetical protein
MLTPSPEIATQCAPVQQFVHITDQIVRSVPGKRQREFTPPTPLLRSAARDANLTAEAAVPEVEE